MKSLVVGCGQIGSAIVDILQCDGYDSVKGIEAPRKKYDVLHICFGYSKTFEKDVREYQSKFGSRLVIIHSTVPIGTSKRLGAVHSPCRGIHPDLREGILTFTKWFGGEKALEAVDVFKEYIPNWRTTFNSDNTEAMKIWDTTQYGLNIYLEKMIHAHCEENNLDFNIVYKEANREYNEGYEKLFHPEYKKYILKHVDGPIGGHCVIPNLAFLDNPVAEIIKEYNDSLDMSKKPT